MNFSYNDFARLYKINHMKRKSPKIKTFVDSVKDVSVFIETLKEIFKDPEFESLRIADFGIFTKVETEFKAVHPITHRKKIKIKKMIEFTPESSLINTLNKNVRKE